MSVMMEVQPTVKPARRKAVKPQMRQLAPKVKSTLLLTLEASQRLSVHAAMTSEDRSAIVSRLILEHLRRYRIQDLGRADRSADGLEDRQPDPAA